MKHLCGVWKLVVVRDGVNVESRSVVEVDLVVGVVHEGHNNLVPAGQVAGRVHDDELGEPGHVLDLLLLQLEVSVEAAVVELLLEGHRELTRQLLVGHLIYREKDRAVRLVSQ